VELSMPRDRDAEKRYARAMWFAVHQKHLLLASADAFADWYRRIGWLLHGDDMAASFAEWAKNQFLRAIDDEDDD
jgi:hypothetical protein